MVDFHNHIIYAVDDGSKNVEMSTKMIEKAKIEEVKYICATPHYIIGEYEINYKEYKEKLDNLNKISKDNGLNVDILAGLEIYIHPEVPKKYEKGEVWGLNSKKYLLIELPMEQLPIYTEDVLYNLKLQGVVPIIAHPERNYQLLKNISIVESLVEDGCLLQMNSGSITGRYGRTVKEFSCELIKRNLVHLIGSDAHNTMERSLRLKEEINTLKRLNNELYNWIKKEQYNIIEGKDIETLPIKNTSKKRLNIFSFFKKD